MVITYSRNLHIDIYRKRPAIEGYGSREKDIGLKKGHDSGKRDNHGSAEKFGIDNGILE